MPWFFDFTSTPQILCVEVDVYYKESKSTNKVSYPESIVSGKYLQQIYFSIKILKIYLCLELFFSGKYSKVR